MDDESSDAEYEVEDILADRWDSDLDQVVYKIKWKGYDDECDQTWEPEVNLSGATEMLKEYKKNKNLLHSRTELRKQFKIRSTSNKKNSVTTSFADRTLFSTGGSDTEENRKSTARSSQSSSMLKEKPKKRIKLEPGTARSDMSESNRKRKSVESPQKSKKFLKKPEKPLVTIDLLSSSDGGDELAKSRLNTVMIKEESVQLPVRQSGSSPIPIGIQSQPNDSDLNSLMSYAEEIRKFADELAMIKIYKPKTFPMPVEDLSDNIVILLEWDQPEDEELKEMELESQQQILDDLNASVNDRLSAAVKLGNRAAVNNLLLLPNLDVEQPDCHNVSLLTICSMRRCEQSHNFCKIAEILIRAGADVNRSTFHGGITPLIAAAHLGHSCFVHRLLQCGADPNRLNKDGNSALMIAVRGGRLSIVENLLIGGADYRQLDSNLHTPMDLARLHRETEIVAAMKRIQLKLKESFKLAVRDALSGKFRLIRPQCRLKYRSFDFCDQLEWPVELESIQPKKNVKSEGEIFLFLAKIQWKSQEEKVDLSIITAEISLTRVDLITKIQLNDGDLSSLEENSSIFPVANWMSTSENLLKLSSSIPAKKGLKPIVMAIQAWKVKKI